MTSVTLNAIALVSLSIGLQACGTKLFTDRPSEGVPNQSLMALPIEVSAQNIEDALAQAADLRRAGEYDRAGNLLTRIVAAFPSNGEAIGEYGKLLLARGRGKESLPFLSRAIQLRPDDWTHLSAQGIALDQLGRHDAALRSYETALELSPNEGAVRSALATRPKVTAGLATPGAGYFVDHVVSMLPAFFNPDSEINERLIVETTLDLDAQAAAEQALAAGLEREGETLNASQGALVAMTPDGAVRALVGGRSYDDSQFNRAMDAYRQPGSAFKPFVYLSALERGWRPEDRVFDGPVTVGNWTPENYDSEYEGEITLSYALAHSSNSASVQLVSETGPDAVVRTAQRLGITADLLAVPSLALGTSEVTPLELVTAYSAFANGGSGVIPYIVTRITTESGAILFERRSSGLGRVMSAQSNSDMTQMMMRTITEGTGRQAALGDRPVAGKTGTSQDYRDAWFVGFTADYVCGVWIGNDNNSPMNRATGGGLPARVFKSFLEAASRDLPVRRLPGIDYLLVASAEPAPYNPTYETPLDDYISESEAVSEEDDGVLRAFEALLNRLF